MEEMDDQTIVHWDEQELIENVRHKLTNRSAVAKGYADMLILGSFGFTNEEQQKAIGQLQRCVYDIAEINRWLQVWGRARKSDTD